MTVETLLRAAIVGLCPRVFADVAPVKTLRPYVTYQQIGGEVITFLDNSLPSKENAVFQINVWDDTRQGAKALAKQIEAALTTTMSIQARPMAAVMSDYDEDMERYGTRQDFSAWCDR